MSASRLMPPRPDDAEWSRQHLFGGLARQTPKTLNWSRLRVGYAQSAYRERLMTRSTGDV